MRQSRGADVIIVGAGVLGAFHALFADAKGYKTLLVERNAFPSDASTRNFGMVPQTIVERGGVWAGFARATARIYESLQRAHDIAARRQGSLYIASTEAERVVLEEFARDAAAEYRCELFSRREALARYPFVLPSYCTSALLFPDDLTLEPHRTVRSVIDYLVSRTHVEYQPHTTIVWVERSGDRCTLRDADGNTYSADHVVVCSGAEYRTLFPEFFRQSGLRLCKLQMMRTVPQTDLHLPHSILSGLSIARYPAFASCPSHGRLREQTIDDRLRAWDIHLLFKQAEDGTVIIGDSHQYEDWRGASAREERTEPAINRAILDYGRSMLNLRTWEIQDLWNGYYLVHPTDPICTHTVDERIHIVTGIGGKGMSTGPGFAQHSVDTILA